MVLGKYDLVWEMVSLVDPTNHEKSKLPQIVA